MHGKDHQVPCDLEFGGKKPMVLIFQLYPLIRSHQQSVVFHDKFLQDLLQIGTFLKRKGQWITAEEMAFSGLKKIIKNFP